MEYRWIEDIEEFDRISRDWDKVLASSGSLNPFLLSDFVKVWWKHFKGDSFLRVLAVYDGNTLVGGIPLCLKRGGNVYGFARVLSYIGGVAANYTEPLCGSPRMEMLKVVEEALALRRDWDVLYLQDVRGCNRLIGECKNAPHSSRYTMRLIRDHENWGVDLSAGLEKYLDTISWKLKKDLRAKRKHILKSFGEISLKEISGPENVGRYFDIYTGFSRNAFAGRKRVSSLEDGRYASFLKDLVITMDKSGRLAAYVLFAGNKVMAVSFGYRSDKGYDWVLTGFDYDLKYYRPGYILMEEQLKHIYNKGGTYCNMYGHERFFKDQWSNDREPLIKLFLIRRTLRGGCYGVINRLENALRSNPVMIKLVRKLKHS